jgi:hypothetical protein
MSTYATTNTDITTRQSGGCRELREIAAQQHQQQHLLVLCT